MHSMPRHYGRRRRQGVLKSIDRAIGARAHQGHWDDPALDGREAAGFSMSRPPPIRGRLPASRLHSAALRPPCAVKAHKLHGHQGQLSHERGDTGGLGAACGLHIGDLAPKKSAGVCRGVAASPAGNAAVKGAGGGAATGARMPGDLPGRRPCPRRGIGRRPHEFEAVAPTASTNPDLSGGHRAASGPFRAEGPRDPTCLFVHQHGDESDHMSPGEGRAPAGARCRRMPPGGTATDEQSRISHRRGQASTPSSQEPLTARGEGALDSRDHAGRRAYCGRGAKSRRPGANDGRARPSGRPTLESEFFAGL